MRTVWLLALTCVAVSTAIAQQQVIRDTTDWRDYYRLQVGNTWEYKTECCLYQPSDPTYQRREVIADTLINSQEYFVLRTQNFDASLEVQSSGRGYLRYDTTRSAIVLLIMTDTSQTEQVWPEPTLTCNLSADFGSMIDCGAGAVYVSGGYDNFFISLEPEGILGTAWKSFSQPGSGWGIGFNNGSGDWDIGADFEAGYSRTLIYLRLDDKAYGSSEVATSTTNMAEFPDKFEIISIYPNPFMDHATVTYHLPVAEDVKLEIINVLGQRVRREYIGFRPAGMHHYRLSGTSLPSGIYFVRFSTGSGFWSIKQVITIH